MKQLGEFYRAIMSDYVSFFFYRKFCSFETAPLQLTLDSRRMYDGLP